MIKEVAEAQTIQPADIQIQSWSHLRLRWRKMTLFIRTNFVPHLRGFAEILWPLTQKMIGQKVKECAPFVKVESFTDTEITCQVTSSLKKTDLSSFIWEKNPIRIIYLQSNFYWILSNDNGNFVSQKMNLPDSMNEFLTVDHSLTTKYFLKKLL